GGRPGRDGGGGAPLSAGSVSFASPFSYEPSLAPAAMAMNGSRESVADCSTSAHITGLALADQVASAAFLPCWRVLVGRRERRHRRVGGNLRGPRGEVRGAL